MSLVSITTAIINDPLNNHKTSKGILPLFTASANARIVIVGQAPGRVAEQTKKPWNDKSGNLLKEWLGLNDTVFYGDAVSLLPMDFYYPGKGAHGDLPPRKEFAPKWHPQILKCMPKVKLIVLVGSYSQKYYLGKTAHINLTETVRNYKKYLPTYLPLVHPSPLNRRWLANNPWFELNVVPEAKIIVKKALKTKNPQ